MSDNRPPVYTETHPDLGEVLIIRASAIGHPCLWELIAAGQNEPMQPVPNVLQRAFDEGNLLEPVVIKMLERDYRVGFSSHQSEGELWLSENVAVRYHSDGIGEYTAPLVNIFDSLQPTIYVVEVKALSNTLWQTAKSGTVGDCLDEYNWQLSAMMLAEQLPGLWVAYNKGMPPDENGKREWCPDQGKLLIQPILEPPIPLLDIQLKASLIKEGVYGEPIISSDKPCDSPDHWPCRYLNIRPEPEGTAKQVFIPDMEQKVEVDRLVTEYLTFKGQYDESKTRYEAARNELVRIAGNSDYIQTDRFYVPIVQGSTTVTDWDKMPPLLRETINNYKRKKQTSRFVRGIKRLGL
jgi:hypothetical protein